MSVPGRRARLRVLPEPALKLGQAEHTRAAILNSALDFLWSRPFRDLTVNALMDPTGLSRSAFYQYFDDLHDLMQALLDLLQDELFDAADPWVAGVGDPVALLAESLAGVVRVGHRRGPLMRAVSDASATDERVEAAWSSFVDRFDDAACTRIEADQEQSLIPSFSARTVAMALNRLDVQAIVESFGRHPRRRAEPVRKALTRIWVSTLYGAEWLPSESSTLVRKGERAK